MFPKIIILAILCNFVVCINISKVDKMRIVEIITNKGAACGTITVNNAVDYVPVVYAGGTAGFLSNGAAANFLNAGDTMEILSMGYNVPLGFDVYNSVSGATKDTPIINIDGLNTLGVVSFLIDPSLFYMQFQNYEMAIGRVLSSTIKTRLRASFFNTVNISMIGVPSTLNGKVFEVPIFLKIAHNEVMTP